MSNHDQDRTVRPTVLTFNKDPDCSRIHLNRHSHYKVFCLKKFFFFSCEFIWVPSCRQFFSQIFILQFSNTLGFSSQKCKNLVRSMVEPSTNQVEDKEFLEFTRKFNFAKFHSSNRDQWQLCWSVSFWPSGSCCGSVSMIQIWIQIGKKLKARGIHLKIYQNHK